MACGHHEAISSTFISNGVWSVNTPPSIHSDRDRDSGGCNILPFVALLCNNMTYCVVLRCYISFVGSKLKMKNYKLMSSDLSYVALMHAEVADISVIRRCTLEISLHSTGWHENEENDCICGRWQTLAYLWFVVCLVQSQPGRHLQWTACCHWGS